MIKFLDFKSLGEAQNGLIAAAFGQAVERVWADMTDRPKAKGKRKVSIEVVFAAEASDQGCFLGGAYHAEVKDNLPPRRSPVVHIQVGNGQRPVINVDQLEGDAPGQGTLSQVSIGVDETGVETMKIVRNADEATE